MSRQKSKSKPHGHTPAASPLDREQAANKSLTAGRFREAIEGFKELLKTERRGEWIEALAQAYIGRAEELQAKGMIPEALTIWRNRASICGKPLAHWGYIECLCKSGATAEALQLVTQMEPGEERLALENRLAATAVLLPPEALSALPEDHALRSQHGHAVAALHAYCAGDGKALDEALQGIPFRSPYRDLRPVLKALSTVQQDPEQAKTLLARVASDSPFAKLVAIVRTASLPDDAWLPALAKASPAEQQALLDLKGCPPERRSQLLELAQLGANPNPVKVLDILLRPHNKRTPRIEALCHHLLPYVEEPNQQHRTFIRQIPQSQFENQRIAALANELAGDPSASTGFWLDAVKAMEKIPEQAKNAALILHRLAFGREVMGPHKDLSKENVQLLERSLKLDGDNPQARLRLIHAYAKAGNAKQARTHLEVALAGTPDDPQTLLAAVETAIASDSHKKAEGYAKRLLELDPINPQVRGLIARAGLAQARKQMRAKRMDLALKELDQALPWMADAPSRALVGVLRALCAPDGADDATLRTAAAGLGGPLCAAFHLVMEAYRLKWEPKALLVRAKIPLDAKPDAPDLANFARLLDACEDKEGKILIQTLKLLRRSIELGASLALTTETRTAVCEALLRRREFQALDVHAKAALQQSPKAPIFVYFSAVAACRDKPWELTDHRIERLEDALEQAKDDKRTAGRIADFLRRDEEYEDFDDDDDDFGPFDPGDIDPRTMLRAMIAMSGTKHFLDMMRRNIGSTTFDAMKAQAGQNEQKLVDLLVDYMLTHSPKGDLLPGGMGKKPGSPAKSKKPPSSATDDSDSEIPF